MRIFALPPTGAATARARINGPGRGWEVRPGDVAACVAGPARGLPDDRLRAGQAVRRVGRLRLARPAPAHLYRAAPPRGRGPGRGGGGTPGRGRDEAALLPHRRRVRGAVGLARRGVRAGAGPGRRLPQGDLLRVRLLRPGPPPVP